MKYSEAEYGRIFVIRLEDGDVIHEEIEALAQGEGVTHGALIIIGGADGGSRLMVGPEDGADVKPAMPIMSRLLEQVHESLGCGTLFPDESGTPILHLHLACGRGDQALAGCSRSGVVTWRYMEAVLLELTGCQAARIIDPETGFYMLSPEG
ncbi:MAG: DNA-binding protein [Desulfobacterales bacterium]|nr:DNA-binding protein [Desulfobacterales bacterium]